MEGFVPIILGAIALAVLVVAAVWLRFFGIWLRALLAGAGVPMARLIRMSLCKVNLNVVVDTWIIARKQGLPVTLDQLEGHQLAKGDARSVIGALREADTAGIVLDFAMFAALDLSGRDVSEMARALIDARNRGIDVDKDVRSSDILARISKISFDKHPVEWSDLYPAE